MMSGNLLVIILPQNVQDCFEPPLIHHLLAILIPQAKRGEREKARSGYFFTLFPTDEDFCENSESVVNFHQLPCMLVSFPKRHSHVIILNELDPQLANHRHHLIVFLTRQLGSSAQEARPAIMTMMNDDVMNKS